MYMQALMRPDAGVRTQEQEDCNLRKLNDGHVHFMKSLNVGLLIAIYSLLEIWKHLLFLKMQPRSAKQKIRKKSCLLL